MKCREAMNLFSPYLDGELPAAEAAALDAHLARCVTCREEMAALRLISETLQAEADTAPVPPGFTGKVMAALEPQPVSWYTRFSGVWKPAVAAAAALALIAAGSLQMGLGQLLTRVGPQVAEKTPGTQTVEPEPGLPHTEPGVTEPGTGDPDAPPAVRLKSNEPAVSVGDDPAEETNTPATGTPAEAPPRVRTTGTKTPPVASNYEARVFLSKQRAISSTFLKVQVGDVRAALDKAFSLGGTYGAEFQLTERISNGEIVVVRLVVGREQAEVLTGKLAALGRVIARDTETRDITGQFNRSREQYQTLLAKRDSIKDAEELAGAEATLRSLESQLDQWDREADRYIIVLWLQP